MALLAHGGEFAFVLFSAATSADVMSAHENATFTAAVILSMLFSPLITQLARIVTQRAENKQNMQQNNHDLDPIVDLEDTVLVLGFWSFQPKLFVKLYYYGESMLP